MILPNRFLLNLRLLTRRCADARINAVSQSLFPKEDTVSKFLRIVLLLTVIASGTLIASPARADALPVPGPCIEGAPIDGARTLYCVPTSGWNGDLVVYGHGYVAFNAPLDFYNLTMPDGGYLPVVQQQLYLCHYELPPQRAGLPGGCPGYCQPDCLLPAVTGRTRSIRTSSAHLRAASSPLSIERNPALYTGGLRSAVRSATSASRSTTGATSARCSTTSSRACCRATPSTSRPS